MKVLTNVLFLYALYSMVSAYPTAYDSIPLARDFFGLSCMRNRRDVALCGVHVWCWVVGDRPSWQFVSSFLSIFPPFLPSLCFFFFPFFLRVGGVIAYHCGAQQ
ncbi:hypothetical protein B0H19DRAFT_1168805 [Mycena capillaripes]|nr:hypothetical protein B0H19DRAFT_1168805 [Mycena capillaripes]